jgi:hypothetical protein
MSSSPGCAIRQSSFRKRIGKTGDDTMQRTGFKFLVGVALNIAVFVMGGDLKAAETSNCKGAEQAACLENGGCSWVRAYKMKSGKQVSAFCRKKPGKKSASAAAPLKNTKSAASVPASEATPASSVQATAGTTASVRGSSSAPISAPNASKP